MGQHQGCPGRDRPRAPAMLPGVHTGTRRKSLQPDGLLSSYRLHSPSPAHPQPKPLPPHNPSPSHPTAQAPPTPQPKPLPPHSPSPSHPAAQAPPTLKHLPPGPRTPLWVCSLPLPGPGPTFSTRPGYPRILFPPQAPSHQHGSFPASAELRPSDQPPAGSFPMTCRPPTSHRPGSSLTLLTPHPVPYPAAAVTGGPLCAGARNQPVTQESLAVPGSVQTEGQVPPGRGAQVEASGSHQAAPL